MKDIRVKDETVKLYHLQVAEWRLLAGVLAEALRHSVDKHEAGCAAVMDALERYDKTISTSS